MFYLFVAPSKRPINKRPFVTFYVTGGGTDGRRSKAG